MDLAPARPQLGPAAFKPCGRDANCGRIVGCFKFMAQRDVAVAPKKIEPILLLLTAHGRSPYRAPRTVVLQPTPQDDLCLRCY
jgi:hypothetical protein